MGLLNKFTNTEKISDIRIKNPREIFGEVLKQASGTGYTRELKYNIFHQIIAFKGVVEGVGCSTLVANTAIALADLGLTICVFDTSIMSPVQDILLQTEINEKSPDWFDMAYEKASPLNNSKIAKGVSVLSFSGKDRGIIDAVSTRDSEELVTLALTELHNKFDLILIDCCHEMTCINAGVLQQAHTVIQVWNDSPTVVQNIDKFVNNCATQSCSFGKMRNVVFSKVVDDVIGSMDEVLASYHCIKIAENRLSKDVARVAVLGKPLYQFVSTEDDIVNYTECIIQIVCHICGIDIGQRAKGTITSTDILNGNIDGTYSKKSKDNSKKIEEQLNIQREIPDEFLTSEELSDKQDVGRDIEINDIPKKKKWFGGKK